MIDRTIQQATKREKKTQFTTSRQPSMQAVSGGWHSPKLQAKNGR
jgi:hypothetical protein